MADTAFPRIHASTIVPAGTLACQRDGHRVKAASTGYTQNAGGYDVMGGGMGLSIQLDQNPDHWVLTLQGDLDYSECASFRLTIDRVLKHLPPATIVDLSALDYLDSSGLGLLLALSKEYTAHGGHLVLVTNESVDNILDLTRLSSLFSCAASMDEAQTMIADVAQ